MKLGDFGFSRMVTGNAQELQSLTGNVGTVGYCAPEVTNPSLTNSNLTGSTTYYHKPADIYSVGVIIFNLMYKARPTDDQRYYLHKKQWMPWNKVENLKDLMEKMMNGDPKVRPTAAEARDFLSATYGYSMPVVDPLIPVVREPFRTVGDIEAIATTMC